MADLCEHEVVAGAGDEEDRVFAEYAERLYHRVEIVEVPFQGQLLVAHFHLPPGYTDGKLPCLVMIECMDAFKQLAIFAAADRFLRRGFAAC